MGKLASRLLPVLGLVACTWPVLAIDFAAGWHRSDRLDDGVLCRLRRRPWRHGACCQTLQ